MTNENDIETFDSTTEPQQAETQEEPKSGSIFEKTVFGSAPQNADKPQAETPPTVHAERVQFTSSPTGAYYAQQSSVPPYGRQNIPPYGQNAQPQGSYYAQQSGYGTPGYTGSASSATAAPEKKRTKKGMKVFFTALAAIVLCAVMITVGISIGKLFGKREATTETPTIGNPESSVQVDGPEMETKPSPSSDSSVPSGGVLTPTQIAAKVRSVSVGILVYSKTNRGVASEGSGVLWKEDNAHTYTYIITCAHVVSGSGLTYTVQTEDGATYDAEVVGADAKTDLAVVRIKAHGLKLAEFGDSSKLQVGDPVYAIGNPGGTEFFGSFTSGIVSAIDRSVKSTYTMVCIQHTAAINPGNSGGALVNQYGQVVGINSQKIIDTQYEGMGFSIPIKSAQSIINSLATYGYVANRPKLGITYAEAVNYQQYSMLIKIKGLPSGSLIITEINSDSSLANTDVQPYDMIIKVDGEELTKPEVLLSKIENGKVGDKLKLTICRVDNNYQTKTFDVTVTLVEEKKEAEKETTTSQNYVDPYDFYNDFFNGLF